MKMEEFLRGLNLPDMDKCGNTLHLIVTNTTFTQQTIVEILDYLINSGINPEFKNEKGQTVLHLAVARRMKDVVNCLMAHKVNLDLVAHFFVEDEYVIFQQLLEQMNDFDDWLCKVLLGIEIESVDFLEWLISKGIDFDCKNKENRSALDMAIEYNLQHILSVLLKYTKDINLVNKENKTLLHLFLQNNFTSTFSSTKSIDKKWYAERYAVDIVKTLLDRGVSADAEDIYKLTPIQLAIDKEEHVDIIQILIERCSNIHHRDIYNNTIFQTVIKYFLSASETRRNFYPKIQCSSTAQESGDVNELYDKYGYTALCYAVADQNMWLVNFLKENGADFSVTTRNGRNLLHLLVTSIDHAEVKPAICYNSQWCCPYEYVFFDDLAIAHTRHLPVIQRLITHGVEMGRIETPDNTIVLYVCAVRKGDLSLMGSFIEKNEVNFCTISSTYAFDASELYEYQPPDGTGPGFAIYSRGIAFLLGFSEINEEYNYCTTISSDELIHLHTKADKKTGNNKIAELLNVLVSKGCEVNAKDIEGNTPLHVAASHENVSLVQKLIEQGAYVNSRNNQSETPLHLATKNSKATELSEILLENGADVNAKNSRGQTILHVAAMGSGPASYQMFWTLLKYGADISELDTNGLSAFSCACSRQHNLSLEMKARNYIHMVRDKYNLGKDSDYFYCIEFSEQEGWHFVRKACYVDCSSEESSYEKVSHVAYPEDSHDLGDIRLYFVKHSMKLQAANLPCDNHVFDSLFGDYELSINLPEKYYEECLKEVDILKYTFFDDDHTSLYTWLNMNFNKRRAFVHNEKLRKLVFSPALEKMFPKYFVIILACYREAETRRSLLEQAKAAWLELTEITLPEICTELIFSYLTNSDLFGIIQED